jgi:hypothetical protein
MIRLKPRTLNLNIFPTTAALFVLSLIDALFFYEAEIKANTDIIKEDHSLENNQVILLFISGLIYLWTLFHVQKGHKLFPCAGALLCLSFILRELDVEKFDLPQAIILLGHGLGRNILLICLWLLVIALFLRNYKHYMAIAVSLLKTRSALFMFVGGLSLIVGSLFDDRVFDVDAYQLYEELSELNGYYFILLASLNLFFNLARLDQPTKGRSVHRLNR